MGNCWKYVGILLGLGLHGWAPAQWAPAEKDALIQTLKLGNLNERDLRWDRDTAPAIPRLPIISAALNEPIETSEKLMLLARTMESASVPETLTTLARLWEAPRSSGLTASASPGIWSGPEALKEPVERLAQEIFFSTAVIRQATEALTDEERTQLIQSLPRLAAEEFVPEIDFVRATPASANDTLALLSKVNVGQIVAEAARLSAAVDVATRRLQSLNAAVTRPISMRLFGRVVRIFGQGNDIHEEVDASLTIDLGGNDVYRGRHGAGVGYASVLLDLAGNDTYEPRDLSIGAAILGIGIARDESGNDTYRARSITLGTGMAGAGIMIDAAGDDFYRSNALAQGFGIFGVGVLVDGAGTDYYDLSLFGQGAARTQGVGALIDRKGRDVYRAGGTALNMPLFEDVHYSFAQGFGMGYREDSGGTAGGVGLLVDGEGDDSYLAETYAQAASYWYGVGVLYDESGHDSYSAYHYAQSSAMHATSAFLFDLKGDDSYTIKFGAAHAIGHDYGVAVLLDRAGNDSYSSRDSNPAVGNANGLAIFLDAAGDDRYAGPPGRGNPARGTGSLGIFVDMAGQDRYREGLADANAAIGSSWGVAWDIETARLTTNPIQRTDPPVPNSESMPSGAELSEIYRKATQWGVGTALVEVQANIDRFIRIGLPAFEWMVNERLTRADRLQLRGFVAVLQGIGPQARSLLAVKVKEGNLDEQRNGLAIAVEASVMEVGPAVAELIKVPALRLQAVRAAGALNSKESVAELTPMVLEPGSIGIAAMVSLSQIGAEASISTAEALLSSPSLPLRKSAMDLLAKHPKAALEIANRMMLDREERTVRIGMELLGVVNTEEALNLVAERLLDPSPNIRIQALVTLNGRCPEDKRLTLVSLRNDPIPAVRAVAARIDPGR